MPYFWPESLQDVLPHEVKGEPGLDYWFFVHGLTALIEIIRKQVRRVDEDYACIQAVAPVSKQAYSYAWFLVNTRVFWWNQTGREMPSDECVAMCPILDLFNHYKGPVSSLRW